jgi:hypothetical protein
MGDQGGIRSTMPIRRSASASNITPPSDVTRPPSKATLTFLRDRLGKSKRRPVSSSMAGVAPSALWKSVGASSHNLL